MPVIMKLCGSPHGPTPYDGQYLKDFDFEAHDGQGEASMTESSGEAKQFKDMTEALRFYRRSPRGKPFRDDLMPNRPLTATNWEFKVVD